MTVRARFDDFVADECYELVDERGTFSAWDAKDVSGGLNIVEEVVRSGNLIAAGFVSYEAAPGLDPSLMVRSIEPQSTLRVAFFGEISPTKLPQNLTPIARTSIFSFKNTATKTSRPECCSKCRITPAT